LKEYKDRLVIFPKNLKKVKKGEADKSQVDEAQQLVGEIIPAARTAEALSFVKITDEMKAAKGYAALRAARSDSRLVGIRLKQAKVEKKEEKPAKDE
jgi:large subunit ribosomal protein L13e